MSNPFVRCRNFGSVIRGFSSVSETVVVFMFIHFEFGNYSILFFEMFEYLQHSDLLNPESWRMYCTLNTSSRNPRTPFLRSFWIMNSLDPDLWRIEDHHLLLVWKCTTLPISFPFISWYPWPHQYNLYVNSKNISCYKNNFSVEWKNVPSHFVFTFVFIYVYDCW